MGWITERKVRNYWINFVTGPRMLISGVRTKDDVIRGEETQMIGLAAHAGADFDEEVVCLFTGTHSKHVKVKKGKLVDFKTYITGELFDLLSRHSILKEAIAAASPPRTGFSGFIMRMRIFIQPVYMMSPLPKARMITWFPSLLPMACILTL